MAARDYILCSACGCKLIYDGYDSARDALELKWGNPEAREWTVQLLCPDCLGKLQARLAALVAAVERAGARFPHIAIVLADALAAAQEERKNA